MLHRYCHGESFWTVEMRSSVSSVWKGILKTRDMLRDGCEFVLGNGEHTDFWRAPWLYGSIPLEVCSEDMTPEDGWPIVSRFLSHGMWDLPQQENEIMAELFGTISSVQVGEPDEEDSIKWLGSRSGSFTFASAWNMARTHRVQQPWSHLIWHPYIPKSYSFLCWRIFWRRLSTLDRVVAHHQEVDPTCCFCAQHVETVDHLFLACAFTHDLWRRCCMGLHIAYEHGDVTLEMIATRFLMVSGSSRRCTLARLALLTWVFSVWEERNARLFDGQSRRTDQLMTVIACRVRDIWRAHTTRLDTSVELLQTWCTSTSTDHFEPP